MPQPEHIIRLDLPDQEGLDADILKYFGKCTEKLGLVPICDVVAFFNYSNRMAYGLDMMPNAAYHSLHR